MKKIYNIALFSNVPPTPEIREEFFFDWSQIEDVPYKVTFTFQSGVFNVLSAYVLTVFCDLGQGNTTFIAKSQTGTTPNYRAGLLGSLMISAQGVDNIVYAFTNTNPPVLIGGRPPSNNFTLNIQQNTPNFTTDYVSPTNYTLILNLETLE